MAGYTTEGFVAKTQEEIISDLQTKQRADVDPDITFGSEEPATQLNGVFSEQLAQVWELASLLSSIDPNASFGVRLDQVGALVGSYREPATESTVVISCTFSASGTITEGAQRVRHSSIEGVEFVAAETVSIPSAGSYDVSFRATVTGPVQAASGSLTVISVPTANWTAATNAEDATPGTDIQSDASFQQSIREEIASGGGSSVPGLVSALSRTSGVTSVKLLNNRSTSTDSNGVLPKTLEAIVRGGTDQDVGQTIFDNASGGAGLQGNTTVQVVDSLGDTHNINFTRATDVDLYVEVNLIITSTGYAGDEEVKAAIIAYGESLASGDPVAIFKVGCAAVTVSGVKNIDSAAPGGPIKVDTLASPVNVLDWPVSIRERADFDTSRIVVNTTVG